MIPKTLTIGPSTVEIRLVQNLTDEAGVLLCGYFDAAARVISLNTTRFSGMEIADTLIHEAIHAMFYLYGWVALAKLREEAVARLLGTGLALLFRDNPELPVCLLRLTASPKKYFGMGPLDNPPAAN